MVMKKKLMIVIISSSAVGIILNLVQINFFDDNPDRLLESIKLFRYFTIQSNLLVAVYFALTVSGKFDDSDFFKRFFGSVFLSIFVTGIVFAGYLEWTYVSPGLYKIGSALLHYISPILVTMYLLQSKEDYSFEYKDIKVWLIYPVSYLVYLIIQGVITNDYLYPFFDVPTIGVLGLVISTFFLVLFFFGMSILLVKIFSKKNNA